MGLTRYCTLFPLQAVLTHLLIDFTCFVHWKADPNSGIANGYTAEVWEWIKHSSLYWICAYLSILGSRLIDVSKRDHGSMLIQTCQAFSCPSRKQSQRGRLQRKATSDLTKRRARKINLIPYRMDLVNYGRSFGLLLLSTLSFNSYICVERK